MLAGGLNMTEWYCGTVVLWYLPVLYIHQPTVQFLVTPDLVLGYQHPTRLYVQGQGTHRICADIEKSAPA